MYAVICTNLTDRRLTIQCFPTLERAQLCMWRLLEWNDVTIVEGYENGERVVI